MLGHLVRWWLLSVAGGLVLLGLTAGSRAAVDHVRLRRQLSRRSRLHATVAGRHRYSEGKKIPISRVADPAESEPCTRF